MHPKHTNEQPLYSETLWEWRAFGENIEPNLQRAVRTLHKKSNKPTTFQDHYLWIPNREINVKLRGDELRIKQLLNSDSTHKTIQQWITQAYQFPIPVNIIKRLVGNITDLDLLFPELLDQKMISKYQFLSDLQTLSITLKQKKFSMLTVKKDREVYLWYDKEYDKVEGVTVEIAKISEPETLYSISLEHHSLERVKSALNYLNISVDSHPEMKLLSYLEVIKYWFDGKKLY
jgi:hypothetical protein